MRYTFQAITNENGSVYGSHKNQNLKIKGFYYQPRGKTRRWIIVILDSGRLKFEEESITIQIGEEL